MAKPAIILLADDDVDEQFLVREALKEVRFTSDLHCVSDGQELLDYLRRDGGYADEALAPRPDLILLDLNMPRMDGREALREIKTDPGLRRIPVIALATSKSEADIAHTYDLGVNSFVTKPASFAELVSVMQALGGYWFDLVRLPAAPSNV